MTNNLEAICIIYKLWNNLLRRLLCVVSVVPDVSVAHPERKNKNCSVNGFTLIRLNSYRKSIIENC